MSIEAKTEYTVGDAEADQGVGQSNHVKPKFGKLSMLSLSVSLMATWEALCSTMVSGLVSGGPPALIYGFIIAFVGSLATAASLAELVSMFPTAGGQYHFISKLAPLHMRKGLSWLVGWISTFGWIAIAASAPFSSGTLIQGLLVLNYEDYVFHRWHGTMIYWAILVISAIANIQGSRLLPLFEYLTLGFHVVAFIIVLVVICVVSPTKHAPEFVFVDVINNSGWGSTGIAWCVGMLSSCYILVGYDGAIHLCEEMTKPRTDIPKVMISTILINGTMGFGFLVAILFCMGDLNSALQTTTGYPIIQIFYNITGNVHSATALSSTIVIMAGISSIPLLTSTSRMIWVLARDKAFPASSLLSKTNERRQVPANAVVLTSVLLGLLGLINIGSTSAFNAIISLTVFGLEISYLIPICFLLYQRVISPQSLTPGPWSMGGYGIWINALSICFLVFTCVFLLFPSYQPVTAANMNYASLVFGAVCICSGAYWLFKGRKVYEGPIFSELVD
ncbi:GABA permease, putative [Talaromyces stipitatus ATCC 10500]|uniref:GABA permease, putative n=1 Tax=Talaromyces stipitatus (strain ATCC 10500 / CBS 375.48 / QM 6759 / NRRL 1006) TaxID=441959 RepID=B8MQD2_TALSN|nr:GABA permease, putative [Talaromyces stipitatus ATCC 10500]EED13334.1 GABA permease, putative [Talaromyces stipitatus ATCC 10500]